MEGKKGDFDLISNFEAQQKIPENSPHLQVSICSMLFCFCFVFRNSVVGLRNPEKICQVPIKNPKLHDFWCEFD